MNRRPSLIFAFVCISIFPNIAQADLAYLDSVEWLVSVADNIGVYKAERLTGPHSVLIGDERVSDGRSTVYFALQKALRGNPPEKYSRSSRTQDPAQLGFRLQNTYIFFLISDERVKERAKRTYIELVAYEFFSMNDYIWLERPPDKEDGVAIDSKGKILSKPNDVLALVEASLKLPRANPAIRHQDYYWPNPKVHYNFEVIDFPTPATSVNTEPWIYSYMDSPRGLVVPK